MKTLIGLGKVLMVILLGAALYACIEAVSEERPPTIAHVHIGHALHGWGDTPGQEGLFVVAEREARVMTSVLGELESSAELAEIKRTMLTTSAIIAGGGPQRSAGSRYGLKRAFVGATNHLAFAARARDATENVKQGVARLSEHSQEILKRIDLIEGIAREVDTVATASEARAFAAEAHLLARQVVEGAEMNERTALGSASGEYGLAQLREALSALVEAEDPPYSPVGEKWLFGLVRLPNGEWKFSNRLLAARGSGRY